MEITSKDKVMAVFLLICGFLYWELVMSAEPTSTFVFASILCLSTGFYLDKKGYKQNSRSLACLGIIIVSAANFLIYDVTIICLFNLFFLSVCYIYWVALITHRTIDDKLSLYAFGDLINQMIKIPFRNFGSNFKIITNYSSGNKSSKIFKSVLIGIIITIPITILVINLLSAADSTFEKIVFQFNNFFSVKALDYIREFILGIPIALYISGLIFGNTNFTSKPEISKEAFDRKKLKFRIAPNATVCAGLTLLNIVYLTFFIAQATYLFSAFKNTIPLGMTYANYARQGFFELCTVAGINLTVIVLSQILTKREKNNISNLLKIEVIVMSLSTLIITAIGLSKMYMYIKAYGMTRLRVYTSWFMILLLIFFIIIIIRQLVKFNSSKVIIITFIIAFMMLAYGNIDGQIAKYNISKYEIGEIKMMDRDTINALSDGAAPYLYDLYKTTQDDKIKSILYSYFERVESGENVGSKLQSWKVFNFQSEKADTLRAKIQTEGL